LGQGELVLVESHENPGLIFQGDGHMPQVKRAARLRPGQSVCHRLSLTQSFGPIQRLMNEGSIIKVFLNVPQDSTSLSLVNQTPKAHWRTVVRNSIRCRGVKIMGCRPVRARWRKAAPVWSLGT